MSMGNGTKVPTMGPVRMHDEHDNDGLVYVGEPAIHGRLHQVRLKGRILHHVADGQLRFQDLHFLGQLLTECHRIDAGHDGDADDDRPFTIEVSHIPGRVGVTALDAQDISESYGLPGLRYPEFDILNVPDVAKIAGRLHNHVLRRRIHLSAGHDDILFHQRVDDFPDSHAELGKPGGRELEKHLLFMNAEKLNFPDAGEFVKAVAKIASRDAHLRHGKAFAPQGDRGHGRQPELVIDEGPDGSRGKLRSYVGHPVADPLPYQIQVIEFVPGLGMDNGHAVPGVRPDVVELGQGAELGFQAAGDQFLHLLRLHAREERRDDDFTDYDGRVFLAREVKELDQTDDDDGGDKDNGQPIGVQ